MASGSLVNDYSNYFNGIGVKFLWDWYSTPNLTGNTSTITVALKLLISSGRSYSYSQFNPPGGFIRVGPTSANDISKFDIASKSGTSNGTAITLGTYTSKPISHNLDGTKTTTLFCGADLTLTVDGKTIKQSWSNPGLMEKSITLDNIPPEKFAPSVSISIEEGNDAIYALTGNNKKLVKYFSSAIVNVEAEAKNEASIDLDTLVIKNGGRTAFSSPATFNNIESGEFSASIKDSNGFTGSATVSIPIVEYIRLTCNFERYELDTAGVMTIDCSGNYFNQSFGAVANTLTVQCRYKVQDGTYSNWMNMSVSKYENTYTASMDISGLNYREKYIIQCRAVDKLSTASTPEVVVKSLPVFHWSENDFVFEVPVVFNAGATGADIEIGGGGGSGSSSGIIEGNATIGGDCLINGNLRLKGSGNYGNSLYFGDGSYAMISESSDDTLVIKATNIELNGGSSVKLNGNPIGYGTWIPTLNNSSAVSSYGVRQGWYSRMGNVITIGWQLKATINSGYSSTSLSISGAPFTPAYAAFGGGIAHNINVSAGFNFEGWTIGTDGAISARLQPCNGTAAGNLQISSNSYYPTGSGNVLTLAGTICYVIN